ncbi:ABC transporter substrate-binding protein [Rhodococcus wratislaviensis]|uniref:ABC transporter substrate-binding protein n=1 Tax=Rhodococcus wratislaviensis TaxID=44752 RepID=UPI00364D5005
MGALMCAAALLLAACGSSDTNGAAAGAEVDPSATLEVAIGSPIGGWDPHHEGVEAVGIAYHMHVYDRLVQMEGNNEIAPMLATEWTTDETGTVHTFKLREDVTFHDGSAFDAAVAKASLDRARGPESSLSRYLTSIDSVDVADKYTLTIRTSEPAPILLQSLARPLASIISPKGLADPASLATTPAGSGPYTLASASPSEVRFTRADDYWDKNRTFAAHQILHVMDDDAALNALRSGQVQVMQPRGGSARSQAATFESDSNYAVHAHETLGMQTLYLNSKVAPFDNAEVRRAAVLALDPAAISEGSLAGTCTPTSQPMIKGFAGYVDGLETKRNLDEAKNILQREGASGTVVKLMQLAAEPFATQALMVQSQLQEAGFTVEMQSVDRLQSRGSWRRGDYSAMATAWTPAFGTDPAMMMEEYRGVDNLGGASPEMIGLLDKARPLPAGSKERDQAYQEVARLAARENQVIPYCSPAHLMFANASVAGLDDMPYAVNTVPVYVHAQVREQG